MDLKQIKKYLSVVNRSITMTLICGLDVVQSPFGEGQEFNVFREKLVRE